MNLFSKNIYAHGREKPIAKKAFSLVETITALIILAMFSSTVMVVINRCLTSTIDLAQHRRAFEVARENMETLLSQETVTETSDISDSDKYPEIQWQNTVETFSAPTGSHMWVRAICSAQYTDSDGEVQTVELTHWVTHLTEEQRKALLKQRAEEEQYLAEEILETIQQAADYAGVDPETIRQWIDNGMPITSYGYYIKDWLDLYEEYDGNPPDEAVKELKDTIQREKEQTETEEQENDEKSQPKEKIESEPKSKDK